jgi:hypothetical protein
MLRLHYSFPVEPGLCEASLKREGLPIREEFQMENAYGVRARGRVGIGALLLPAPWKPTGTPLCDRVALR